MNLETWAANGWLKPHESSRQEVGDLLCIVERDLHDAECDGLSNDWRFGIAYNAALKLCTIPLYASGYRPLNASAHYRTIASLQIVLGVSRADDCDYLETCRRKRNIVEYDRVGGASKAEADELIQFAATLQDDIRKWLRKHHPQLL